MACCGGRAAIDDEGRGAKEEGVGGGPIIVVEGGMAL